MTLGRAILSARNMSVANEMLAQAKKLAVRRNTALIVKSRAYYLLDRQQKKSL